MVIIKCGRDGESWGGGMEIATLDMVVNAGLTKRHHWRKAVREVMVRDLGIPEGKAFWAEGRQGRSLRGRDFFCV